MMLWALTGLVILSQCSEYHPLILCSPSSSAEILFKVQTLSDLSLAIRETSSWTMTPPSIYLLARRKGQPQHSIEAGGR